MRLILKKESSKFNLYGMSRISPKVEKAMVVYNFTDWLKARVAMDNLADAENITEAIDETGEEENYTPFSGWVGKLNKVCDV